MTFNDKETATLLSALRCLQMQIIAENGIPYPEHFEEVGEPTAEEIDVLAEKINFAPTPIEK